jgi:hypothetical protein
MKKVADLVVKVGTYQKDGQTKNRYINVGSKMEGDKGSFFLLNRTFNPAGVPNPDNRDSIIISVFEKKDEETKQVDSPDDINWMDK